MTKITSLLEDTEKALALLEEVVAMEKSAIVRDAAIQRFEIAFELLWKAAKAVLEDRYNTKCLSPRACFRAAFKHELIEHDDFWMELTKLRNYTSHTYNEEVAEYVFGNIPKSLQYFQQLYDSVKHASKQ